MCSKWILVSQIIATDDRNHLKVTCEQLWRSSNWSLVGMSKLIRMPQLAKGIIIHVLVQSSEVKSSLYLSLKCTMPIIPYVCLKEVVILEACLIIRNKHLCLSGWHNKSSMTSSVFWEFEAAPGSLPTTAYLWAKKWSQMSNTTLVLTTNY